MPDTQETKAWSQVSSSDGQIEESMVFLGLGLVKPSLLL